MLLFGTLFWTTGAGTPAPAPPPVVTTTPPVPPSGGFPSHPGLYRRPPTPSQVSRDRERFGIQDEIAARLVREIAARQAKRLELDAQKRFEELTRELELKRIEFDARYLEAMNVMRDELITQEIAALLQRKLKEENDVLILMMIAAAAL